MTVIGDDFLFIHVPKNAGKSVSARLGGVTRGVPGHAPRSWFAGGAHDGKFSFGFVRNPWDRMVSSYEFICTKTPRRNDDPRARAEALEMGFRGWLTQGAFYHAHDRSPDLPALPAPYQRRSQMYWLEGCDYIGRVETLGDDMAHILGRITPKRRFRDLWTRPASIPFRNRTARGDYRAYYDDETRAFVARHAAEEIERFGYVF
ncbi:MAG: sulfotransferase family 2 domain-containing protein [Rhodobacteraceae bacterium]|nr:sulfotransferase family 2 domain-containing protein [Paracoccaceae bacterium]